jgi:hypothetical protein
MSSTQIVVSLALALPLLYFYSRYSSSDGDKTGTENEDKPETDDAMSSNLIPSNTNSLAPLPPPKDDPFTLEQLKEFDGNDSAKPIYISIKGTTTNPSRVCRLIHIRSQAPFMTCRRNETLTVREDLITSLPGKTPAVRSESPLSKPKMPWQTTVHWRLPNGRYWMTGMPFTRESSRYT